MNSRSQLLMRLKLMVEEARASDSFRRKRAKLSRASPEQVE
jgi:hypothetical protein